MAKGRKIEYSVDELAWIKKHCTLPRKEAHVLFCEKFMRPDLSFDNFKALCTRKGWHTGRTGCYEPGAVPANKGKKMPYNAKRSATQFKKGQRSHNTKYEGHERISKDGYVEISVSKKNKHTGFERSYVLKHRYLWEQKHGPVPDGMCLKCLDGDRQNCEPDNWEAIDRGALPFLNGRHGHDYESAPAEVKPVILTVAKLKHTKFKQQKKVGNDASA